jgi:hypothetical protein
MSIERVFYCDGPDCERYIKTRREFPPLFLTVTEHAAETHQPPLHFCGWDCVLRQAATKEPEQMVPGSLDA